MGDFSVSFQGDHEYTTFVRYLQVDVDECPQTANEYKVQAMPTFMFFKNG